VRLFAALELPPETRRALAGRLDRARESWPEASWVRPENLHLTLAFFGETPEERLPDLERELAAALVAVAAFPARTGLAGGFPERGPVRVVWIAVEPAAALERVARAVRDAATAAGAGFDDKPFRSHVTLARCRRPWPPRLRERLPELAPGAPLELPVTAVSLIASELAAGGSRYTPRARLALGGAP
jgi:2'-5' RNA ligase